jgi:serine/threonine protein kinase
MAKWDPESETMPDPNSPPVESALRTRQNSEISNHYTVSDHPNIVTLHECFEDHRYIYMVMDFCPGPDLYALMTEFPFWRDDARCKKMFLQVLDAVEASHNLGVFHRDIKPENILSSKDGQTYYLADFGLAIKDPVDDLKPSCGTFCYMSPGKCILVSHFYWELKYGTQSASTKTSTMKVTLH